MKFWEELKRRKIVQVATVYAVVGWLLIQITSTVFPPLKLPDWTLTFFIALIILGFPVALIFAWAQQLTATPYNTSGQEPPVSNSKPSNKLSILGIIGGTLLIILVGIYFLLPSGKSDRRKEKISIAIIPFRNQTRNEKLDGYSYGIASEIRTQLAMSGQFDFISSDQATIRYADSRQTPEEIAAELGVDFLLFGSFYQLDDKLKISAELAEGSTSKSLWSLPPSDASVSSIGEMFNVQSTVSKKVLNWFSMKEDVMNKPPTENLTAYDYYLAGRNLTMKVDTGAMEMYKKAIALDSNFLGPRVYLFIEEAGILWDDGNNGTVFETQLKPKLEKIERIAPNSWETNLVRGYYYYWGIKNYDKGLEYFKKVLEVNPDSDEALGMIGVIFRRKLMYEEAFPYLVRAVEMNPRNGQSHLNLADYYHHTGDLRQAWQASERARKIGTSNDVMWGNAFWIVVDSGNFNIMPPEIRKVNEVLYNIYFEASQGNWKEVVKLPGFVPKAYGYFEMGMKDSAKYYALKQIERMGPENTWSVLKVLAGDTEGALRDDEEHSKRMNISHFGNNLLGVCFHEINIIIMLSMGEKYKEATEVLLKMNHDYPNWGNYQKLMRGFETAKIRKEYPPFVEALKNLKLPHPPKYPERLQDINPK